MIYDDTQAKADGPTPNAMADKPAVSDDSNEVQSERAFVKKWQERIKAAKNRWEPDFKRMKENIEFASGFQWQGQQDLNEDRYIANLILRFVNQKVSMLYARDPKAEAKRKPRLDFEVWDGKMESLQQAMAMQQDAHAGPVGAMLGAVTLQDYLTGQQLHDRLDRICKTMDIVYAWMLSNQQPTFKVQMKQLVRRVVTTGVGYVKLGFSRAFEGQIASSDTESTIVERAKRAKYILQRLESKDINEDNAEVETLKSLILSIGASVDSGDTQNINERLVFDFPSATSIIIDPRCRAIKGFVGAQWIAQEFFLPLDTVREFFEQPKLKPGAMSEMYTADGAKAMPGMDDAGKPEGQHVCLYQVWDLSTKSTFFICAGYHDFVQKPEPVAPETNQFWPIRALTFNDIECEPGCRATIYPPSDVQLLKSPQREWNKSREGLRQQRRANSPKYFAPKGILTEDDKAQIESAHANSVIELEGCTPGTDPNTILAAFKPAPIDPMAYDTGPLNQDMFYTLGTEEGPQPSSNKATATAATINEQSRITNASSNVDDLDDLLSDIAEAGGEILIRELSMETVKRIAGPGALWPEQDREDYLNCVLLEHVAASSGRPNKALEISNWSQIAPILQAAGANPQFILRETLKRFDDRLKAEDAFPVGPPMPTASTAGSPPASPHSGPRGQGPTPTSNGQMPAKHVPHPAHA